jgi:hypothetical protein
VSQNNPLESLYQEELYVLPSPLLIILSKPWADLSADELTTLTRMIHAVKLNLGSVQVIVRKDFTIESLSSYAPKRILAFGAALQSNASVYENLSINNVSIIISEPLDQLDDAKKKSLWTALKSMFGL